MHLGLLLFGWVMTIWGAVMLVAFGLLRAQRRATTLHQRQQPADVFA